MLVVFGAVAAGFVQGLSGFAFALVATVFWSGVLPPQVCVPLIALGSVAGQLLTIRTVWASLDLRRAAPMVLGGVLGVPFGVALLPFLAPNAFRLGVGILLLVYCPAMLFSGSLLRITAGGRWADGAAGFLGGIMGGLAGLAGVAPTIWCMVRGWDRDAQRAVFQTFLVVSQGTAVLGFVVSGAYTPATVGLGLWVLPLALLPSLLGARLYARFSAATFRRLVLVLLLLTGLAMVVQGLG